MIGHKRWGSSRRYEVGWEGRFGNSDRTVHFLHLFLRRAPGGLDGSISPSIGRNRLSNVIQGVKLEEISYGWMSECGRSFLISRSTVWRGTILGGAAGGWE
ncbi:hypothetical protein SUGI_1222760 [Cryptomeria japonica]|uniref:Uncharacterized protein n=1 Tax=Cryptomeria japonica TaxID=3369 RepID=A0AAD3NMS2_CRYJA|nr:hypothetical protein SUGI_1222760 [Cryptomeria japonica]